MAKKPKTPKKATAKEAKAPEEKKPIRRRRQKSDEGGFIILLLVGLLALAPVSYQAALLSLIGLMPSVVMSLTDQKPMKSERLQCIALLNLAGILPYAYSISQDASQWPLILGDYSMYVFMWGSAAAGYLLLNIGPIFAAIVIQAFAQDKLKNVAQQRQELVDLWGSEVLGDASAPAQTQQDGFIRPKRN